VLPPKKSDKLLKKGSALLQKQPLPFAKPASWN
jgi:hypothetical protein